MHIHQGQVHLYRHDEGEALIPSQSGKFLPLALKNASSAQHGAAGRQGLARPRQIAHRTCAQVVGDFHTDG